MRTRAVSAFLACGLPILSCNSVTLDLRRIEEPVLLNDNPFCQGMPDGVSAVEIGTYKGEVGAQLTRTVNNAQPAAFREIGGMPNRAITDLVIEMAMWTSASEDFFISATGKVREYRR